MKRMFSYSSPQNVVIANLPLGSRLCAMLSFSNVDFNKFSNHFSLSLKLARHDLAQHFGTARCVFSKGLTFGDRIHDSICVA